MQAFVPGDAYRDTGARDRRSVVFGKEFLHLTHAFVRVVQRRPEKVKIVIQELLDVYFADLMPAARLRFTRIKARQQKRVSKTTRHPCNTKNVAVSNVYRDGACVVITVTELTEVVATPRPNATISLHGSNVLPTTTQRGHAYAVHGYGVGGLGALHNVTQPQLPKPAVVVKNRTRRHACECFCLRVKAAPVVSPGKYLRVICRHNSEVGSARDQSNLQTVQRFDGRQRKNHFLMLKAELAAAVCAASVQMAGVRQHCSVVSGNTVTRDNIRQREAGVQQLTRPRALRTP
jgi:hypothetical protein